MRYNRLTILMKSCIMFMLLSTAACMRAECPVNNPTTTLTINEFRLTAEVATNTAARNCGLALRESLPANYGMLFVFEDDRILQFWMKNTVMPLTIAYLDVDGEILEIHEMDPHEPERRVKSSVTARYALETNQGWLRTHGVEVGDRISIHLPADLKIQ